MKKFTSVLKSVLFVALAVLTMVPVMAFAADTGSISFVAQTTGEHKIVQDADFELYRVADYDVKSFTLRPEFSGLNLTLESLQTNLAAGTQAVDAFLSNHTVAPMTTMNSRQDGKITFSNLPNGVYFVKYKADAEKDAKYGRSVKAEPILVAIPYVKGNDFVTSVTVTPKMTVTEQTKPVSVSVTKKWDDGNSSSRPSLVEVSLFKDGKLVATVQLNADNQWTYVWKDMDSNGLYEVKEQNVPTGYVSEVKKNGDYDFVVTNKKDNPIKVTVNKVWVAKTDKLPTSVRVQLFDGDKPVGEPVTLSDANKWTYTWTDVPSTGKYTVKEVEVPAGYVVDVKQAGSRDLTFTITNTLAEPVNVTVNKVWKDQAGKERPLSISVQLYNGDKAVGEPVTLSDGNQWTYTWKDIDGTGKWSVKELNPPKDYTVTYDQKDNTITITNTFGRDGSGTGTTLADVVTGSQFAWLRYTLLVIILLGAAAGGYVFVRKRRGEPLNPFKK